VLSWEVGKPGSPQNSGYTEFQQKGGMLKAIRGSSSRISPKCPDFPMLISLTSAYIGGNVKIGLRKSDSIGCPTRSIHEVAGSETSQRINQAAVLLRSLPDMEIFAPLGCKWRRSFRRVKFGIESPLGAALLISQDVEMGETYS